VAIHPYYSNITPDPYLMRGGTAYTIKQNQNQGIENRSIVEGKDTRYDDEGEMIRFAKEREKKKEEEKMLLEKFENEKQFSRFVFFLFIFFF
jgi:hypothetical protein